ncbi:hypothetical protein OC842_004302 [Tilletia horrida]|uniref:Transmembrane protein n=1 Tax=Tilletia horrida TaxID=155126 RepID=A0AAN6GEM8_9BASI|nr:hypothetical protein OC842_004302 [Tilletia horrida]
MDLYQQFDLPSPPSSTFLTRDHGPHRARFPDSIRTAAELREFVHQVVVWHHPAWAQYIYLAAMCFCTVYVLSYSAIIVVQTKRRSWRLFRLERGSGGPILTPHVQNSISFFVLIFMSLFISCEATEYISWRRNKAMPHIPFWSILMFYPIVMALFMQLWGVAAAGVPRKLIGRSPISPLPALFVNIMGVAFPLIMFAMLLPPAILAELRYGKATTSLWPRFQERHATATQLSREMLLDAQEIWKEMLEMCFFLSVGFISWVIIGFTGVLSYIVIFMMTIIPLRAFLNAEREHVVIKANNTSNVFPAGSNAHGLSNVSHGHSPFPTSSAEFPSGPATLETPDDSKQSHGLRVIECEGDHHLRLPACSQTSSTKELRASLAPTSAIERSAHNVLIHISIQGLAFGTGGIGLTALAAYLAITIYPAMEQQSAAVQLRIGLLGASIISSAAGLAVLCVSVHATMESTYAALVRVNDQVREKNSAMGVVGRRRLPSLWRSGRSRFRAGSSSASHRIDDLAGGPERTNSGPAAIAAAAAADDDGYTGIRMTRWTPRHGDASDRARERSDSDITAVQDGGAALPFPPVQRRGHQYHPSMHATVLDEGLTHASASSPGATTLVIDRGIDRADSLILSSNASSPQSRYSPGLHEQVAERHQGHQEREQRGEHGRYPAAESRMDHGNAPPSPTRPVTAAMSTNGMSFSYFDNEFLDTHSSSRDTRPVSALPARHGRGPAYIHVRRHQLYD